MEMNNRRNNYTTKNINEIKDIKQMRYIQKSELLGSINLGVEI